MHRRLFDHWIWETDQEVTPGRAWLELLRRAMFKAKVTNVKGRQIALERGQLIGSHRKLGEWFNWDKNKVDRFLKKLRRAGMIETETGAGVTIITICNYDHYNPLPEDDGALTGAGAGQERGNPGAGAGQHRDNINKGNKGKELKKGNKEKSGVPLHTQAADSVIKFLNENPEHLKLICNAARFSGDWEAVVIDLYCRKSDAPYILRKAIAEPTSHLGWLQSDMQGTKYKNNESGPKKATFDQANELRSRYGIGDTS